MNIAAKEVYESVKNESGFYPKLKSFAEAAEKFNAGERKDDIVFQYLKLSGDCEELVFQIKKLLQLPPLNNVAILFEALTSILVRCASDLNLQPTLGSSIVQELLTYGIKTIHNCVKNGKNQSHVQIVLRLLASMVAQGPIAAQMVYSKLALSGENFTLLLKKTNLFVEEDLRTMYINVIVLLLNYGSNHFVRQIVEEKGFLNAIFSGLLSDKADTILLILETFSTKIINNESMSKTSKIRVFNDNTLRHVYKLFTWVGPMKLQQTKPKKRKLGDEDGPLQTQLVEADEKEIQSVRDAASNFLLLLCTSYKSGIIFRDSTLGTSGKNQNHILTIILKAFPDPHMNELASEFVLAVMKSCPDQMKFYLHVLKDSLQPRQSLPWLLAIKLLTKIVAIQDPVTAIFKSGEKRAISKNLLIGKALCLPEVFNVKQAFDKTTDFQPVVSFRIFDYVQSVMQQILNIIEYCDRTKDNVYYPVSQLKEFKEKFLPLVAECLPKLKLIEEHLSCIKSNGGETVELDGVEVPSVESHILKIITVAVLHRKLFCSLTFHDNSKYADIISFGQNCLQLLKDDEKKAVLSELIDLPSCDGCTNHAIQNNTLDQLTASLVTVFEIFVTCDSDDITSKITGKLGQIFSCLIECKVSEEKLSSHLDELKQQCINGETVTIIVQELLNNIKENPSIIASDARELKNYTSAEDKAKDEKILKRMKRKLNVLNEILPISLFFQQKVSQDDLYNSINFSSPDSTKLIKFFLNEPKLKDTVFKYLVLLLNDSVEIKRDFIIPTIVSCLRTMSSPREEDVAVLQSLTKFLSLNLGKFLLSSRSIVSSMMEDFNESSLLKDVTFLLKEQTKPAFQLLSFLIGSSQRNHATVCSAVITILQRDDENLENSCFLFNVVLNCLNTTFNENLDSLSFYDSVSSFLMMKIEEFLLGDVSFDLMASMEDLRHSVVLIMANFPSAQKKINKIVKKLLKSSKSNAEFSSLQIQVLGMFYEGFDKRHSGKKFKTKLSQLALNLLCLEIRKGNFDDRFKDIIALMNTVFEKESAGAIKNLFSTMKLDQFSQDLLKVALRNENFSAELLSLFNLLCRKLYSSGLVIEEQNEIEEVNSIHELITSHSKFCDILLDDDGNFKKLKLCALELLVTLVKANPKVCKEAHVPLLFASYSATLSLSDQHILYLIKLYEESGVDLSGFRPFIWGNTAISHYSLKKGSELYLWKQPQMQEVLRIFRRDLLEYTALNFPLDLGLEVLPVLMENEQNDIKWNEVYDPRFVLMLLSSLLGPGTYVHCKSFIESNVLGVIFMSLSSNLPDVRALGYYCLSQFYCHLEGSTFGQQKLWISLLDSLRNSVVRPNCRISCIVTLFLTKTVDILMRPDHIMYVALTKFLTVKPTLEIEQIPEFYKLFNSIELEFRIHRSWILSLVEEGLRTSLDFHLCQKRYVFSIFLPFYSSSISNFQEKRKILGIINAAVKIFSSANTLCKDGLLVWIHSLVKSENIDAKVLKSINDIMINLWKTVSCAFEKKDSAVNDEIEKSDEKNGHKSDSKLQTKEKFLYFTFPQEFLLVHLTLLSKLSTDLPDVTVLHCSLVTLMSVLQVLPKCNDREKLLSDTFSTEMSAWFL